MKDSGVEWLGEVPAHWGTASVKRHYSVQLGKMLQSEAEAPSDQEAPYLKAQHVQWFSVCTSKTSQRCGRVGATLTSLALSVETYLFVKDAKVGALESLSLSRLESLFRMHCIELGHTMVA